MSYNRMLYQDEIHLQKTLKFTEEGKTAKQEEACCLLLVNLMRHSGMETSSITEK